MAIFTTRKIRFKSPLFVVLVVSFVTLNLLAFGSIGYLSYRHSRFAVDNVSLQLRGEIMAGIKNHLQAFLSTPQEINQTNASLLRQGLLASDNQAALENHFREQIKIFKTVSSIYFGNKDGGLVDAGREGADALYVMSSVDFARGPLVKYALDASGQRREVLSTVPDFDARKRPWYAGAVNNEETTWSEPYILSTGQDMAIAISLPAHDKEGQLLGVLSVDLFLSHLGDFLRSLKIGESGQAFIIQRSGLLVASSVGEAPFTTEQASNSRKRLSASESSSEVIRLAALRLAEQFGAKLDITREQYLHFQVSGKGQFLQVSPLAGLKGLDWLIVVTIPEADFMAKINANNRLTLLLTLSALAATILVGIVSARKIITPLAELETFAKALSEGQWQAQPPGYISRISEIGTLTESFSGMAVQLQQKMTELTTEIEVRKLAETALIKSENSLRQLLETANSIILRLDKDANILFVNEFGLRFFGYRAEELIGRNVMAIVPQSEKATGRDLSALVEDVFRNPHKHINVANENITSDGTIVWVVWTNKAILDAEGNLREILAIGNDITALKVAESEKALLVARLQDKYAEQERFVYTVSHDLKSPLVTISGFLGFLEEDFKSGDEAGFKENLAFVANAAKRMKQLLEELLELSRIGIKEIVPEPVALGELVEVALRNVSGRVAEVGSTIVFENDLPHVLADPKSLLQVMENLLDNAIKFSSTAKGGSKIGVGSRREAGELICYVKDNGIGIDPRFVNKLFGLFEKLDPSSGGTGVGLAIVKRIIELHGGRVWVESEGPGLGSTFFFTLPEAPD